jgi:tRNA A37 threonylcarbamoyladenosine modification protein TsaB
VPYSLFPVDPAANDTSSACSLDALLTAHGSLLVLDTASDRVHVGWCADLAPPTAWLWRTSDLPAGEGLFAALDALFAATGGSWSRAGAWVFCAGPGSTLGIRTAAVALRTAAVLAARPVFAYQSLALLSAATAKPVLADARREAWHVQWSE